MFCYRNDNSLCICIHVDLMYSSVKVALNHRYLKNIVFEIFTPCNHQILIFITVLVANSSAKCFLGKIDVFPKLSGMNTLRNSAALPLIDLLALIAIIKARVSRPTGPSVKRMINSHTILQGQLSQGRSACFSAWETRTPGGMRYTIKSMA